MTRDRRDRVAYLTQELFFRSNLVLILKSVVHINLD